MPTVRIGVDLDDLRVPIKSAMSAAAELDLRAVEFATVRGELAPRNLSTSGRRHLAKMARDAGLTIEALTADMPGLSFRDPATADERVSRTREVIELAAGLQVPVVTASMGALSEEPSAGGGLIVQALQEIGSLADARGVRFALRPSRDRAEEVAAVLKRIGCPSVCVGLDPADLVMHGVDPSRVIEWLASDIALFHARDATAGGREGPGHEAPLGQGEVDLVGVLACLEAAAYSGPRILRRTHSVRPMDDFSEAARVLRGLLPAGA